MGRFGWVGAAGVGADRARRRGRAVAAGFLVGLAGVAALAWAWWWSEGRPPDPEDVVSRLPPGPGDVRVRSLGDGIVELTGRVASEEEARAAVRAALGVRGVRTVLNRLWVEGGGTSGAGRGGTGREIDVPGTPA